MLSDAMSFFISTYTDRNNQWIDKSRQVLLDIERQHIHKIAKTWCELVNRKVTDTNATLSLAYKEPTDITPFLYKVNDSDLKKYLQFIMIWKGFDHPPKIYNLYINKSKKWLYTKRTSNYTSNLYPDLINAAEIYANKLSQAMFPNDTQGSQMYSEILIMGCLSCLYSSNLASNQPHSRVAMKNNLKQQNNEMLHYWNQQSQFFEVSCTCYLYICSLILITLNASSFHCLSV